MINEKSIKELLDFHLEVSVFDELASTNLTAREIAACGDGRERLIIARSQTSGRGRLGRSFFSPVGGLYMSLLLYPKSCAKDALRITTAAAVAVSRAVDRVLVESYEREFNFSPLARCEIKWVNDVYLYGKKICGILTEAQIGSDGTHDFAILGIGINLADPIGGFPSDIASRAGTVFDILPENADNAIAAAVINEFYRIYTDADASYIDEYRSRSNLTGREVDVMRVVDGDVTQATVIGIDDDFSLIVEYGNGKKEVLSSGEVSVREK